MKNRKIERQSPAGRTPLAHYYFSCNFKKLKFAFDIFRTHSWIAWVDIYAKKTIFF